MCSFSPLISLARKVKSALEAVVADRVIVVVFTTVFPTLFTSVLTVVLTSALGVGVKDLLDEEKGGSAKDDDGALTLERY
jgi:hypothetical protein